MNNKKIHKRTMFCGELSNVDIGNEVCLNGWVQNQRNLGSLIFVDLRDYTGISQLVFKEDNEELFNDARNLRGEFVVSIKGDIRKREAVNLEIPTGEIEVLVNEMTILNKSKTPPIYVKEDDIVSENLKLKYRYLDMRKPYLQKNLRTRAEILKSVRTFLENEKFLEVETPILTKATPEGARDYLVPSRVNPHKFYGLPQSPQLLKQMLMLGGIDRYYQIAKCFRDEDLRANRQPEFTQLDIEMSFIDMDDIIEINERLIKKVFKDIKNIDIKLPLKKLTYNEAMENYGSDKPDLRFEMLIKNITNVFNNSDFPLFKQIDDNSRISGICVSKQNSNLSRKKIEELEKYVKTYGAKQLFWIKFEQNDFSSSLKKYLTENEINDIRNIFNADNGDLILIVKDIDEIVFNSLGALRVKLGKDFNLYNNDYSLLWVIDFPLFEYNKDEERYESKHHPFTHPNQDDIKLIESDPEKIRALAYDIVINGDEIGGGSIRINDSDLQNKIFNLIGIDNELAKTKFGFFTEAFEFGAPPHGGIAYGIDRLTMTLLGVDSIKDVIAFPKTQSGSCLLTNAPSDVDEQQLKEIHIKLD